MAKNVAVLLSGCGVFDGSEIHEAVITLLTLSQAGAHYTCCAPNDLQSEVVNHLTGETTDEKRNMLVEAARIARGKIRDVAEIKSSEFDALILPGGYGAAKNLCSYAREGASATPHPEVARVIREFSEAAKPIGSICISPVVLASVFQQSGVKATMTIGTDPATAADLGSFGADHQECAVCDFVVDKKNKIVTSPAYMYDATPAEVQTGIEKLVKAVLEMC